MHFDQELNHSGQAWNPRLPSCAMSTMMIQGMKPGRLSTRQISRDIPSFYQYNRAQHIIPPSTEAFYGIKNHSLKTANTSSNTRWIPIYMRVWGPSVPISLAHIPNSHNHHSGFSYGFQRWPNDRAKGKFPLLAFTYIRLSHVLTHATYSLCRIVTRAYSMFTIDMHRSWNFA